MDPITGLLLRLRNRHFLVVDLAIFLVMPLVALILRMDGEIELSRFGPSLLVITAVFAAIKLIFFFRARFYTRYWRYASIDELAQIVFAGMLALLIQFLLCLWVLYPLGWIARDFPRSVAVLDGLLVLMAVGGVRYSVPLAARLRAQQSETTPAQKVVIAGAGAAGVAIVREMQTNQRLGLRPVAFVDDDPDKQGARIRGVPVLGRCADLPRVTQETHARHVIIAMPTASGKVIRAVVHICEEAGIQPKTVPSMGELLDGTVSVKQLRDVKIEDLLRREPVQTDVTALGALLHGRRVLITGAGGSIGSELCRQVLELGPGTLILLGHGENSIFQIHNELLRLRDRNRGGEPPANGAEPLLQPVIADIRDARRIRAVFAEYRPEVVFHSAAHKHVPLMEMNPVEAITNNVLGTRNLLEAAEASGVGHFVMISTDKAVNPVGVMGASKRVAELLVHDAAERSGRVFVAVRFGNVLGSRGSVVHTFEQQIAAGGPVTVTHPDMHRYFMTIPEAVQLVLQAAVLGRGGEVFMLDMGEPVRIVDLARDLIELSGVEVGRDIDIAFTGMRPGEKLFEEMFLHHEAYERTRHEKVFLAPNAARSVPTDLAPAIRGLIAAAEEQRGEDVLGRLQALVPEFRPVGQSVVGHGRSAELLPAVPARPALPNGRAATGEGLPATPAGAGAIHPAS